MNDKIRMIREIHQWSQEEMAGKMNMSLSGYAKLERGETKLHYDKLLQIAQIFNISIKELVDCDRGLVFLMNENGDNNSTNYFNQQTNELLVSEIEKLKLSLSHKEELLVSKERELEHLRKIISLLENK